MRYYIFISIIGLIIFFILMYLSYVKLGLFKQIFHDKLKIHVPDLNNWLDYNSDTKTVFSACKYCDKELIYYDVCKYLVHNTPEKIPSSRFNLYCKECVFKNYTKNKDCCPIYCNKSCSCRHCEEGECNK